MANEVGYAVMRAIEWDAIEINGIPLQSPPNGPHFFIPVFSTQEQAAAFAKQGDHIIPVRRS